VRRHEIELNGWPEIGPEPTCAQAASIDLGPTTHSIHPTITVDALGSVALVYATTPEE
jgi:hypothetical protein